MTVLETKLLEALKGIASYVEKVKPGNVPGGAEGMLALIGVIAAETVAEAEGAA